MIDRKAHVKIPLAGPVTPAPRSFLYAADASLAVRLPSPAYTLRMILEDPVPSWAPHIFYGTAGNVVFFLMTCPSESTASRSTELTLNSFATCKLAATAAFEC